MPDTDGIEHILAESRLVVHLQPITAISGRTVFGFESLIRGIDKSGNLIPPFSLFEMAKNKGMTLELDKLARRLAVQAFKPLWQQDKKRILFVNFEPKLIENFETGSSLFYGELQNAGIPYQNIVLEVKEDEISDTSKLKDFCNHYRELGFNIALDDFGSGQSSFDRIAIVRPDIIKIDRSLMANISQNQINREIVNAVCKMCQNIGALALAEGVETLDETVFAIAQGALLMQGYYFAKPSCNPLDNQLSEKVSAVQHSYAEMMGNLQLEMDRVHKMAKQVEDRFLTIMNTIETIEHWESFAQPLLTACPSIEAIYLIDEHNKQVGSTLIKSQTRALYEPTPHGHDYSLKTYYIRARNAINGRHLTRPYLSLASGSLCRTHASCISVKQSSFVLCIDFAV
ncbi:MAG: EAL domain-containing protein [Thiotrichales bacterium]|jgi:EAL domain-containing protein (putative c-di-GMP-specific phosphodiesterase class I)|nr:EAL domain-containing protein [Thiotrichales bacterium]